MASGARPFVCAACGKDYPAVKTLNRHYRTIHSALTGGLSSDPSWVITRPAGNASAGNTQAPQGPAAGSQPTIPVGSGGQGGAGRGASQQGGTLPSGGGGGGSGGNAPPPPLLLPSVLPGLPRGCSSAASSGRDRATPHPEISAQLVTRLVSDWRQLRSSRSTRNQEHNAAARNRAGAIDWDPTEGLPVRKWERVTARVNQDASADPTESNNQGAQNGAGDFPWPELPLPPFISQLPPYSQELLRRARLGNTNIKPSEWDAKTSSWISGSEIDARNARLKSKNVLTVPESPNSHEEDDNEDDNDDLFDADGIPTKRRKTNHALQERVIEIKKWAPIDPALAEKLPEPKYLADRRPGMESLYGGAYKATNGFGTLGINPGAGSGAAGYDLGDGSGLGNAGGVLGSTNTAPEPAPVRKNMPPRRKKKKLGGPGRRKANPLPPGETTPAIASRDVAMTDTPTGDNIQPGTQDGQPEAHSHGDPEGSGSESEGEGSEEGEIDEAANGHQDATASTADHQVDIHLTKTPVGQREVDEPVKPASPVAPSDTTAPNSAVTERQLPNSDESLPSTETLQTSTARQQVATMPTAVPEPTQAPTQTHPEPQPQAASTSDTPLTETAWSAANATDEAPADATSAALDNTAFTVVPAPEPETQAGLVLEQAATDGQTPQNTAVTEPTTEDVTTEDAVAPVFKQVDERSVTQEQTQVPSVPEPTDADVNDVHPSSVPQPEQAPTSPPLQTSEEQQEPQHETADDQPEAGGELDLLGGLEAAVEKEHRAL